MKDKSLDDPETNSGVQAALIAEQNDIFRKAVCGHEIAERIPPRRLVLTQAVDAQGPAFTMVALKRIALFSEFNVDYDPHGWHEFGEVEVNGRRIWFKVDLYDIAYNMGSETPHDVEKTRRVLTVLFPEYY